MASALISQARQAAGLSMAGLAELAGTSRPTLSAYEHGRVSPTLHTVERILTAAGYRLCAIPLLQWREVDIGRGRTASVPDQLPDLPAREAVRALDLPLHLEWSRPESSVDLADRRQRARVYETVLREGRPADIESIIDGALLIDLWNQLVLPRKLRAAWEPVIESARGSHG